MRSHYDDCNNNMNYYCHLNILLVLSHSLYAMLTSIACVRIMMVAIIIWVIIIILIFCLCLRTRFMLCSLCIAVHTAIVQRLWLAVRLVLRFTAMRARTLCVSFNCLHSLLLWVLRRRTTREASEVSFRRTRTKLSRQFLEENDEE
jgi:hypothetical protein